jgi:hypothetical protein
MRCTGLPTFLSKVRACTVGRRPDFHQEAVHRSGTVPESHRLRDHAAVVSDDGPSVAHPSGSPADWDYPDNWQ